MDLLLNQLLNGLALGSSYALFGISFGLLFATMNMLNVAAGTYATWGAVLALLLVNHFHVGFVVLVLAATCGGAVLAAALDLAIFSRLRSRPGDQFGSLFIASIGAWIVLDTFAGNSTGNQVRSYPRESTPEGFWSFGGISVSEMQVIQFAVFVVVTAALVLVLNRTGFGASVRAVGYDSGAAELSGVNPLAIFAGISAIAGAVAGLDGALAGSATSNISISLGSGLLLKGFAAVVIGGFGNVMGTAFAGLAIGVAEVLFSQYVSSGLRDALTFGLLLLFLIVRPYGLFGKQTVVRA